MNREHPRIGMSMSNYLQGQNSRVKMDQFFKLKKKLDNIFVDLIFILSARCTKQLSGKVL